MVDGRRLLLKRSEIDVDRIIKIFAQLSDGDSRSEILSLYEKSAEGFIHPRNGLWDHGIFSSEELISIVSFQQKQLGGPSGVNLLIFSVVDEKLQEKLFIHRMPFGDKFQLSPIAYNLLNSGNIYFHVHGFEYIVEKMKKVVPAINVTDSIGNESCGSGVILRSNSGAGLLITNKHVIERSENISVVAEGKSIKTLGSWITSDKNDLAKVAVELDQLSPDVNIAFDNPVLGQVVSMGYPRVPTAKTQEVLAHRGEVNGIVKTQSGHEFLAISCHVSPGNSGGPIFDSGGYCAGIVTQSSLSQEMSDNGAGLQMSSTYHMAIGVEEIKKFIS